MPNTKVERLSLKGIYNTFKFKSFNYDNINAMITRNGGQAMVGIILRMIPAMGGQPSQLMASVTRKLLVRISSIAKDQGIPGVVKYLKTVSVQTQQFLGGHRVDTMSPRVSRTKSGIPRLFPPVIRAQIRKGNTFFIKYSLTIASLYRDMQYEGPLKLGSITNPFNGNENIFHELGKYIPFFTDNILKQGRIPYSPRLKLMGLFSYFPLSKSSPQVGMDNMHSSSPLVMIRSAKVLYENKVLYKAFTILEDLYNIENTTPPSKMIGYIMHANPIDRLISAIIPRSFYLGKLGLKVEAAGKMRVFAMVDPWSQWLLAPIHKVIFNILKNISTDGTHNQLKPLKAAWLGVQKPLFSMDLSSATDRLPIRLQASLLASLFDLTDLEAQSWSELLVGRSYALSSRMKSLTKDKTISSVTYSVGQPMGALSSWAMLA